MTTKTKVPNRLAKEKSPYLLQHAHNPVDWYPWGEEAFAKAKGEDKPIFLSIGYSTCHWCHVMERESFEDEEVAEVLNSGFVSIKVDREERPDIDHLYMTYCQSVTGHGGWPLTIIMTPDKKPFYAGTYFPKESRRGMPGIIEILERISQLWNTERNKLSKSGEEAAEMLIKQTMTGTPVQLSPDVLEQAYKSLYHYHDREYGGFGSAPKFPTPHNLTFLLRYAKAQGKGSQEYKSCLAMVEKTLTQMYKGGIFDHVGYGFSRYSTDGQWLAPHFEKMLYDNALLAIAYLETYQETKKQLYREVAEKIFTYVLRDMTSPEGAFYSAEDADSEGVEGKFYLWDPHEAKEVLGKEEGEAFCRFFDIREGGNFEGKSIPNLIKTDLSKLEDYYQQNDIEELRDKLFQAREKRVHPYKDDKVLTSWNALMIVALAKGARIMKDSTYSKAAETAVQFIMQRMRRPDGRLLARYRDGEAALPAYLDDYAFLVWAHLELYEATYLPKYLKDAIDLNDSMLSIFEDKDAGGLYMTGEDAERLLTRPKEVYDGAVPSGNSVAAMNLLRLSSMTGDYTLEEKASAIFNAFGKSVESYPAGYTFLLQAYQYLQVPTREIVIVQEKEEGNGMVEILNESFMPYTVSLMVSPDKSHIIETIPFVRDYHTIDGKTTAYVCENFTCQAPVTRLNEFKEALFQKDVIH